MCRLDSRSTVRRQNRFRNAIRDRDRGCVISGHRNLDESIEAEDWVHTRRRIFSRSPAEVFGTNVVMDGSSPTCPILPNLKGSTRLKTDSFSDPIFTKGLIST